MSHATADLEYFQCDMCQTYMHRDIYCNHRRECKGKDSQEIRKADVIRLAKCLDDETRLRAKQVACGEGIATLTSSGNNSSGTTTGIAPCGLAVPTSRFAAAPKSILTTTNLDKAQKQQGLKVLRTLETTTMASAVERSTAAVGSAAGNASHTSSGEKKLMTAEDIDDFLSS